MKSEDCTLEKKTHYTESELNEFRDLIRDKLKIANEDLALLTEAYTGGSNEHLNTSHTFKVLEEAENVNSKETNASLAGRQEKFIKCLENALVRIENNTYGICAETGKLISKERLRCAPHATLSIEGKKIREAREKNKINGFPQNSPRKPFSGMKKSK